MGDTYYSLISFSLSHVYIYVEFNDAVYGYVELDINNSYTYRRLSTKC